MKALTIAVIVLVVLSVVYFLYRHNKKCSRSISKSKDCGCGCNGEGCEKKDQAPLIESDATTEDTETNLNEVDETLLDPYGVLELPPDQGTGLGGGIMFPNDQDVQAEDGNYLMQTRASAIMRTYIAGGDWIVALDVSEGLRESLNPIEGFSVIWKKADTDWKKSDVHGIAITARDTKLFLIKIGSEGNLEVYVNNGLPGKWEFNNSLEDFKNINPDVFNELLVQVKSYVDKYKDFLSGVHVEDLVLAELLTD